MTALVDNPAPSILGGGTDDLGRGALPGLGVRPKDFTNLMRAWGAGVSLFNDPSRPPPPSSSELLSVPVVYAS